MKETKQPLTAVPTHLAIIMDGNGRWAKKRLLPRSAGHRQGMNRMIGLAEHAFDAGVKYFTAYALSTENLSRPQEELDGLFSLFREYFAKNAKLLKEKGVRLNTIGDLSLVPQDVEKLIRDGEALTAEGKRGTLTLAIGYGGRQEILAAVNEAVRQGKELSLEEFNALLYTGNLPYPDFLIRTGKEVRLSNFLLWQSAYAELYFTDVLFPDFSDKMLDEAFSVYAARERKYGKV